MKRLGRFTVSSQFFDNLQANEGLNLFHSMIVLRASENYECNAIDYIATHPDFKEVKDDERIPEYVAQFFPNSIYPKWVKREPAKK